VSRKLKLLRVLLHTFGWRGLVRRGIHETRCRLDLFRARPKYTIAGRSYTGNLRYRPKADLSKLPEEYGVKALARGGRVVAGAYEAYGHEWRAFPQTDAEWRRHPQIGYEFSSRPWWCLPHLSAVADIKDVWEPGRFSWVYDLIRAYSVSGEAAYAETFYRYFESWEKATPPFRGVHWVCGQEVAIRSLALLHAMDCLPPPPGEGAAAWPARLLTALAWSGERIADAIGYGLSQRNNHGISEACGLVHIGLRLRGIHPDADDWLKRGKRLLEEQIHDQFSEDGWYAQHSFTYMRVALEQALIAQISLIASGLSLPEGSLKLLAASFQLLSSLVDSKTGHVPNHGANDGGRTALFTTANYRDFRPILTLSALVLDLPLAADITPDAEVVTWLGGSAPRKGPPRHDGVWVGSSGWVVARVGSAALFLRAGCYRHRPSHLDTLHMSVSFDHIETIVDAGTFAYNAPEPWNNPFVGAAFHNGPIVDGSEPAERGPRFLWYSWPKGRIVRADYQDDSVSVLAEIPGRARREVQLTADEVRVTDSAMDPGVATLEVSWLLNPNCRTVQCVHMPGAERLEAVEEQALGWFSPSYGLRLPSTIVRARRERSAGRLELQTTIRSPLKSGDVNQSYEAYH